MYPEPSSSVIEFLTNRLVTARTCLSGHAFPEGVSAAPAQRFVWSGDPEGTYSCELELKGMSSDGATVPARFYVDFIPETEVVSVSACLLVDQSTGGVQGSPIGYSPYVTADGPFLTSIDGKECRISWDLAMQKVHFCASEHVDRTNPDELAALRALHYVGCRYGARIEREIPGLPRIEKSISADTMLSMSDRRTDFGEKLALCLKMAARDKDTPLPLIGDELDVVANLWANYGHVIEANFVLQPKVVRVDFQRGIVVDVEIDDDVPSPGM